MIVITIANEEGVVLDRFWTDETYGDVHTVVTEGLAVYDSKEELEEANNDDSEG